MNRRAQGARGERCAEEFLIDQGYEIVERNVHSRVGEVDLVARIDDTIVFVEVKAWDSIGVDGLEEAIDRRKRRRIIHTAVKFIQERSEFSEFHIRFDVVYVTSSDNGPRHIIGAFDAE